jgi:hypothetical protein
MAHPEIVGVDEQQAGIGRVSQEAVRSAGIPRVHCHLAIPFQTVLPDTILMDAGADEFESPILAHVLVPDERRGGDGTGAEWTS